jgi:protein-S-isoprenylcysteine O-methyltransferase Ste14
MRHVFAAILATTFWVCWFALVPLKLIELNDRWGWTVLSNTLLQVLGLIVMAAAIAAVAYCCFLFGRVGKGTPVPGDPAKRLVSGGLYNYTRNPIYLAYVGLLLGQFLYFGSVTLLLQALVTFLGFYTIRSV